MNVVSIGRSRPAPCLTCLCREWEELPTVFFAREEYANLFHAMRELFNVYHAMLVHGLMDFATTAADFKKRFKVVILDGHAEVGCRCTGVWMLCA